MATMSVSGVVSGMDWDSMIDEIITNAAKPAQVQVNKRSNLTRKKSLFEEMKVTMNSLQSSLTPLKLPSTYKAKQVDIERIDTNGSYKGVLTATVNADAEVNVYDLKVNQLARAQTNRSKQITSSTVKSALSDQGLTSGTMYINMAGQKVGIEIDEKDSLQTIKTKINNTVKTLDIPVEVTASIVDNKLVIRSDNTGLGENSMSETLNYSLNGKNTITAFSVNDSDLGTDRFTIRANGNKLTYGKDYDVVNGNEIRWNQFEETDNVKLGEKVTATYKIGKGDMYEATGTYGTSEASVKGLTVKDDGTLSTRLKIVDEDNKEYVYGQDFTLDDDGKVEWIKSSEEVVTNEPDSYTVSYTKTSTVSSTISGTKGETSTTYTTEPESYIVRYDDKATGTYSVSAGKNSNSVKDSIAIDYDELNTLYANNNSVSELPIATFLVNGRNVQYLDPADRSDFKLDVDGTSYEYGKDYVIIKDSNNSSGTWEVAWATGDLLTKYRNERSITANAATRPSSGTITFSYDYGYDYTRIGRVNSSDNDKLLTTVFGSDFDMSGFNYNLITIRGYEYGTDYTVNTDTTSDDYGEIQWLDQTETSASIDDVLTDDQFTELQEKYNQVYGTSSIPTITLTDADGVLRTYLDPADTSAFTMTSGSSTYEYGKDYVIRANDDGSGYVISWAITDDANSDGNIDINYANTSVTTYTKYKELSTQGMLQSPANGESYDLKFSGEVKTPYPGTVSSSATDKSLSTILGETLSNSEYSSVVISSGSTTYTQGKDYVIDSEGEIKWLNQNTTAVTAYKATYTFSTADSKTVSDISASGTLQDLSGLPTLSNMGVKTFASGSQYYVDEAEGKAAFTLTDSAGNVYEYGKDFAVRSTSTTGGTLQLVFSHYSSWPSDFSNQAKTRTIPVDETLTLTYNNTAERIIDSSATLEEALGFTPSDYSKLTLYDVDGNEYTEGTDYELDESTGTITWYNSYDEPAQPDEGATYTLIYDPLASDTAKLTYNGEDTQKVVFTVEDGEGKINGNQLSYEQIFSEIGLSEASTDEEIKETFAKYFTILDENGEEAPYKYGVDYRIINSSDETGNHTPLIEWINTIEDETEYIISYSGRGSKINLEVERSYTDSVQTGSSGVQPLYSYFDGGTSTITQGSKTFYEGIDYEIVKTDAAITDDYGNPITYAAVEWKTGSNSEWYFPTSNAVYTINLTAANGRAYSFRGARESFDTLDLRDYGFTSVNGTITSVSYTGNTTHTYDLTSYGITEDEDYVYSEDTDVDENTLLDSAEMRNEIGLQVQASNNKVFSFNWVEPLRTVNSSLPSVGEEFTAEYTYNANTFTLSDDSDGKLLAAFELDQTDSDHYTAAQNAELELDGETITRDSNDIGESYDNELIKGMTIHLKGIGEVSLDVAHDAEKAVESIQTFVDTYNDLMTWMNTRMTESQVDEDTAATIDSDDFRMRWGLLHGNSLLRNTKSKMRSITSQNFTFSFTQRTSAEEIYGTMGYNGLKNDAILRLRINSKFVDVDILPTDTLQDIIDKINDDSKDGPMHNIYYDDDGNKLADPLLKAEIKDDKLVISSTGNDSITMSGTSAMNALKMNYTYKGLYQLGIATTSEDYGKSGELEFDTSAFMEALEDNPDEVQELMLMFAQDFDSWTKSMLTTSASGETSGTLTRQIEDLETQINSIDDYLEKYQERLDRQEKNLRTKYANTETSLAKLTQQASSIAAILNQLNGTANSNSSSDS